MGVLPFKSNYKRGLKLRDLLNEIAVTQKEDYRHLNYLIGDLSRHLNINSSGIICVKFW
jgi:surfactin family lipopeptide synthetase A